MHLEATNAGGAKPEPVVHEAPLQRVLGCQKRPDCLPEEARVVDGDVEVELVAGLLSQVLELLGPAEARPARDEVQLSPRLVQGLIVFGSWKEAAPRLRKEAPEVVPHLFGAASRAPSA